MRIVLNLDVTRDPNSSVKKKLRVRTSYKSNSEDPLSVVRCGKDVYAFIQRCINIGLEGVLVEHIGEQR